MLQRVGRFGRQAMSGAAAPEDGRTPLSRYETLGYSRLSLRDRKSRFQLSSHSMVARMEQISQTHCYLLHPRSHTLLTKRRSDGNPWAGLAKKRRVGGGLTRDTYRQIQTVSLK